MTARNVGAILSGKTFRPDRKIPPPLTPEQVRAIRKIGDALPAAEVAKLMGTNKSRVERVRNGSTYGHIK